MSSVPGRALCALYLACAALCMAGDLTRAPSPLILPDMTFVIALPGVVLASGLAELAGAPELTEAGVRLLYVPAVLFTAGLVYLFGAGARALLAAARVRAGRTGLR